MLLKVVIVVGVVFNVLFLKGIKGEDYTVGDENRWDSQIDYGSWAAKYNFTVGDALVFKYNKEQHDVYEVTQSTFQSCDISNGGVLANYDSGDDRITLNEAKRYWFICNKSGHCLGGMRFSIHVQQGIITTLAPSEPPFLLPPPTNSCKKLGFPFSYVGFNFLLMFGWFILI